jgi:hypothetical protein
MYHKVIIIIAYLRMILKKVVLVNLKYHPMIYLGRLRKTLKFLIWVTKISDNIGAIYLECEE